MFLTTILTHFAGFIDLNLNALLPPDEFEKWSDKNLPPDETLPLNGSSPPNNNRSPIEKIEWVDLFQKKSVRGWLPLCATVDKKRTLTVSQPFSIKENLT